MDWTIIGGVVAVLSLIVNIFQLVENKQLKKVIVNLKQSDSNNKSQTSSGSGTNYMADRDISIGKK